MFAEELGTIAINSALFAVSTGMGVAKFYSRGVGAELKELSPGAGAGIGLPRLKGDSGGSEVASEIDRTGESHVVAAGAGAEAG